MAGQVPTSFLAGDEVIAEYTADVLVKLLMSQNISIDFINDPRFRTLLESVAQHGRRSCMLLENPTIVQKSLWKWEDGIKQYMRMVIESWKITGCTLMVYNLGSSFAAQNKMVLGFYCPKGLILTEVSASEQDGEGFWNNLGVALHGLAPDVSYSVENIALHFVRHDPSYYAECQYQAVEVNSVISVRTEHTACIRQQIQMFWRMICKKCKWIRKLKKKSDELYTLITSSDFDEKFYIAWKEKGFEKVTSSFESLEMVMKLEFELKAWLYLLSNDERFHLEADNDVATIIRNDEFWRDGKELLDVLTPLFRIPSVMDTLVPSAGYLDLAIANAKVLLSLYSQHKRLKYKKVYEYLDDWKRECLHPVQSLASRFNPAYIFRRDVLENLEAISTWLCHLAEAFDDDEKEAVAAEINAYSIKSSNPFGHILASELEGNHPITLWSKYGDEFPLLRKVAYKLLSQPACCLCAQVEKHISKLQGSDNLILRFNALMMDEFSKMGNEVYDNIVV